MHLNSHGRSHSLTIITLLLVAFLFLPGCSTLNSIFSSMGFGGDSSTPDTPESLVMTAMNDYNRGKYSNALKSFNDIKERFPFSKHSMLAELKAADCHYYLEQYQEAIVAYKEFEVNHPTNEAVPYVLFQIARSSYEQIDTIDRDPGAAMDTIAAFSRLLKSAPGSSYTDESRARISAARNFLANHEMYVAAYYLRTKEYDQSESRLKYLLQNYPETSVASKAEELLAAIQSGNPPQRTWRDWIPDIGMPDWNIFTNMGAFGGTTGGGGPE